MIDQARYWLAVLLVIGLPPAVGWWFVVHPFIRVWRRVGPRWTLTATTVFMLGSMAGLFLIREPLVGADLGTHVVVMACAAPFLIAAVVIQRKRRRHLTLRILTGVPEIAPERDSRLLTGGIYARIRHPRYVEFTLGSIGWSLFGNHLGTYVVTGLTIAMIYVVVLLEERELRERFGEEYAEYARRVPRFVPRRG